jgi:uncharacterized protein YkwD
MRKRLWITSTLTAAGLAVAAPAVAADDAVVPVAPAATFGETVTAVAAPDLAAAEQAILQQTNQLRAAEGKAPLTRNPAMDAVAAGWATHMATTGDFRHNPDYSRQIPAGWRTAGENIAMNSWDPVYLGTQWQNSPGHRANMVNPAFNRIGIAVVQHGGAYYGVQVFGGY